MNEFVKLYLTLHTENRLNRGKITVTKLLHKFIIDAMNAEPEKYKDVLSDTHLVSPYSNHMNRLITIFVIMNTPTESIEDALKHFSPKRYDDLKQKISTNPEPLTNSGTPIA